MTSAEVMSEPLMSDSEPVATAKGDEHALENTWCLWVLMHGHPGSRQLKNPKDQWQNQNACVHTFCTVEEFWCLYNNIHGPAQMFHGDLSFFKQGISPAWEDPTCAQGGRWLVKLEDKSTQAKMKQEQVEETWLNLILALIGEGFSGDDNDFVCGAVLSSRAKGSSKLALWVRSTEAKIVVRLGETFKQILRMTMKEGEVGFENFEKKAYERYLALEN